VDVKELAMKIAESQILEDDRKIAALENLAQGVYTAAEVEVFTGFHITSAPLKLFFLLKSHKMALWDIYTTQNNAAFLMSPGNCGLTEEQRFERALNFRRAEIATKVRASFYFKDDIGNDESEVLKVMWLDPMLCRIALGEDNKVINRFLTQTDRLERGSWLRLKAERKVISLSS
jgi:hypothetical protein